MVLVVVLRVAVKARIFWRFWRSWESNWVGHLEEARVAGVATGSAKPAVCTSIVTNVLNKK